jgi:HEAT repeat protein
MGALAKLRDPRAVEPLAAVLEWQDRRTTGDLMMAIQALGQIGDQSATGFLLPMLQDRSGEVRRYAVFALDKLGWTPDSDEAAVARAIAAGDWDELVRIGAPAVEPLVCMLGDQNDQVRQEVASALGQLEDQRAVEALASMLDDAHHCVAAAAAKALDTLGWKPADTRAKASYLVATEDWKECVEMGSMAVEPLIRLAQDRDFLQGSGSGTGVACDAVEALAEIGDGRAVDSLIGILTSGHDIGVRRASAKALVAMYHSGKLDQTTRAKIRAQRETITYREDEPEWDEERFGNPRGPWVDSSVGVDFPLDDSGSQEGT